VAEHKGACCSSPAAMCYWFAASLIAWEYLASSACIGFLSMRCLPPRSFSQWQSAALPTGLVPRAQRISSTGGGGMLKVGVRGNREQSSFPECSCGGSVEFLTCGVVNVPETLSTPVKLNSDHAPTEMLLAYEGYAASLIFFSGHVH
jgi:hypothetical protein